MYSGLLNHFLRQDYGGLDPSVSYVQKIRGHPGNYSHAVICLMLTKCWGYPKPFIHFNRFQGRWYLKCPRFLTYGATVNEVILFGQWLSLAAHSHKIKYCSRNWRNQFHDSCNCVKETSNYPMSILGPVKLTLNDPRLDCFLFICDGDAQRKTVARQILREKTVNG